MRDFDWEDLAGLVLKGGVTVLTGAGVSTDSGLPDFRGRKGLWKEADLAVLLSAEGARDNFQEFTRFCKTALREVLAHEPNMTHHVLAMLQRAGIIGTIITQNVDGYHQEAGSGDVIEVHGSIRKITCISCGITVAPDVYLEDGGEMCVCGGRRRPAIVLFGEGLEGRFIERGFEALSETKLLIVIGSKLEVAPVAFAPAIVAKLGGKFAVINGERIAQEELADLKFYGPLLHSIPDFYNMIVKLDRKRHGLPDYRTLQIKFSEPDGR